MIHKLENINLTVGYLLELTKDFDDNTPLYNSCYYAPYTEELLKAGRIKSFEPLYNIYNDDNTCEAVYDFNRSNPPVELGEIRKIPVERRHLNIERDVDYGYRYEYYENIVYYEGAIVLC